ncbi:MAG: hypothetical protein RLZZ214_3306, partial [Verrucomicrobiota bacterium]
MVGSAQVGQCERRLMSALDG